jgi:hypothetical protein
LQLSQGISPQSFYASGFFRAKSKDISPLVRQKLNYILHFVFDRKNLGIGD